MENKENTLKTIFPHRFKRLRTERGFRLKHVSEATGLATSTIGNIETGTCPPSLEAVMAFARSFDVSLDYLTGFDFELAQEDRIKICKKIKELRQEMGYTEKEFSRFVNIPIYHYLDIEDGKLPSMEALNKIAKCASKGFKDVTGFTERELEDMYTTLEMVEFAKDKGNLKFMKIAMRLKEQKLDPDNILLGVKILLGG